MIQHTVTYTPDFEENEVKKTLYFNLRLSTLQRMITIEQWDKKIAGMGQVNMDDMGDRKRIQEFWDELIERSYGIREGDRHRQSPEISADFMGSPEYDALIVDILYTDENSTLAGDFLMGLFPKKLVEEIKQRAGGESDLDKRLDALS